MKESPLRAIAVKVYCLLFEAFRKIRYGYFIKNWLECRKNRELLAAARLQRQSEIENRKSNKPAGSPADREIGNPLVSVRIHTYNRAKILTERTIPSVLRQTYQNFELIIVGDHCTDETEKLMRKFTDPRIKFHNLPQRGDYPENLRDRWRVAGAAPANRAIDLCSGEWIAPLDDDDEFSPDHLELLLNSAREHHYELVYGKIAMETKNDEWIEVGSAPLRMGEICHLAILYSSYLKFFKYDINSWKYYEPADWNMWKRMKQAGVRIGFIDRVVGNHYKEMSQKQP